MGLTTLYFAPTAQGTGDGSSAANAAALFSGGAWNSIITGFAFNGANGLEAHVLPGTYTYTSSGSLSFTNAPTAANPLILIGCDSSGNPLTPTFSWTSDQPAWSDSSLPVITWSNNIQIAGSSNVFYNLLKFTPTGITNRLAIVGQAFDWCSFVFSSSDTTAYIGSPLHNCIVSVTATGSFEAAWGSGSSAVPALFNTRLVCSGTAAGGNRHCIETTGTSNGIMLSLDRCTIVGFPGWGFADLSTVTATRNVDIQNCVIANNTAGGIQFSAASQTQFKTVANCSITGNGGFGIDAQSAAPVWCYNNRLDRNTSGNLNGLLNNVDRFSYTTAGSDAADYNNAAGGDYRIASGAGFANRNIGVSQMSGGGGSSINRGVRSGGGY